MIKSVQCHPEKKPFESFAFLEEETGYSVSTLRGYGIFACWAFLELSSMIYLTVIYCEIKVWGCVNLSLNSELWSNEVGSTESLINWFSFD